MIDKEAFGILAIVFAAVGYGSYLWSVLKGRTKPHVFSWLVWGLLSIIVFAAQRTDGAGAGAWVQGFSGAACFLISGLALVWGEKDIKKSDWVAFLAALAAIPIWRITGDPLWAVVWATLIDMFAFYPTIRKSYYKPREETVILYSVDIVKFVTALCAMENFSVTNTLYYFVVIGINTAFVAMLLYRRAGGGSPLT